MALIMLHREAAGMRIEQATITDFEAILGVDQLVTGDDRRSNYLHKAISAGYCWTALTGETTTGLAVVEPWFFDQWFLSLVVVRPEHRRKGVAKALILHVESICSTPKLFSSTNTSNAAMRRVLETCGFVRSGRIENLDPGDPEIIYFKLVQHPD